MSTTKLILIYGAVLLSLLLFILWFIDHSGLGIPEIFPGTTIQTYTASVFVLTILVLVFFQRHLLKLHNKTSIWKLILYGFVVCFFAQLVYQIFRQWWDLRYENNDKMKDYFTTMAVVFFLSIVLNVFIAIELKKSNAFLRVGSVLVLAGLYYLLKSTLTNFTW
jgi:hypothetical protein